MKLKVQTPSADIADNTENVVEVSDIEDCVSTSSTPEKDISLHDANAVLVTLDETPIKTRKLSSAGKKARGLQKLDSVTKALKRKLEVSYDVRLSSDDDTGVQDMKDIELYKRMLAELKEKCRSSQSYQERVQILTVSPFNIEWTMAEFNASNYLVKKSRQVKNINGILGQCDKGKGNALTQEIKDDIRAFYEHDDNSRMCPGKKEFVMVRDSDEEKVAHQKRLVLLNLKELYAQWKCDRDKVVGFLTFASLRPSCCVLAGASGTHTVCVCKHHQNPKLMVAACLSDTVYNVMSHSVCSTESEKCMMGQCKDCPGVDGIKTYLSSLADLQDVEEVEYKQWVTTDRTALVTIKQTTDEYIENLANQLHKLTRHSYTAKAQSEYMKTLKSSLVPFEEIILQGDFAENYSYVVQDEIQSFHWENSQATLHPFVAYRSEDGTLVHRNICVIGDSREHSTTTVWTFQNAVLKYLKSAYPELKKVHYFSDGCAGQYKNKYNFINLCYHKEDFGLEAEWNFFTTSHGKSACDGIGGTTKRLLTKES